jgi:phosphoribosylformimino-5-aminoimidazole carboxamide ribotide isomerase
MRVIPVIDLKDGLVVHAVAGQRAAYRPVESVWVDSAEPLAVLRVFRDRLGCDECYLADLNAIERRGDHRALIARLAREPGIRLMADVGADDPDAVNRLLALGVNRAVVGSETLPGWPALCDILAAIRPDRIVFSLDMRQGRVLSRDAELAELAPLDLLDRVARQGVRDVILLDLARVGTGRGLDLELLAAAARRFPDVRLIAGGGVRGPADLVALQALGVAGVLVATALHRGLIGPDEVKMTR